MKGVNGRRKARRDANEGDIVGALKRVGARVQPLSAKGCPDLLVQFRGELHLIETKTKKGKLTPAQVEWHLAWGAPIIIARSVDDALKGIGAIDD